MHHEEHVNNNNNNKQQKQQQQQQQQQLPQQQQQQNRDARVLSMLLVLRALAKKGDTMHVIAENQQDQTSGLAVCPPTDGTSHEPGE